MTDLRKSDVPHDCVGYGCPLHTDHRCGLPEGGYYIVWIDGEVVDRHLCFSLGPALPNDGVNQ